MKTMKKTTIIAAVFLMALSFIPCGASADEELANSMAPGTWTTNPRYITFGEYNGHALKWRVLAVYGDKTAFLVLDDVLREEDGDVYAITFETDSEGVGNNFPASEIFTFLNDTFLSNLAEYQGGILTAAYGPDAVDGSAWNNGPSEASSQVFLLGAEEAMNPNYFKDDADRAVNEDYWLRSPVIRNFSSYAAVVWSDGSVYVDYVFYPFAVRPALKIDLSSPVFTSALVSFPAAASVRPGERAFIAFLKIMYKVQTHEMLSKLYSVPRALHKREPTALKFTATILDDGNAVLNYYFSKE